MKSRIRTFFVDAIGMTIDSASVRRRRFSRIMQQGAMVSARSGGILYFSLTSSRLILRIVERRLKNSSREMLAATMPRRPVSLNSVRTEDPMAMMVCALIRPEMCSSSLKDLSTSMETNWTIAVEENVPGMSSMARRVPTFSVSVKQSCP